MLNKVMLIGRLGRDPEVRYTQSGVPVATLNMATDESYIDRDGNRQDKTEWHRVVAFQKTAENCKTFLGKGSLIYVEGSLQTRKWQDQQGQERYTTEVKAQRILFLDRKGERGDGTPFATPGSFQRSAAVQDDEEKFHDWGSPAGRVNTSKNSREDKEELGPAFPSEASQMDDYVF